MGKNGTTVSFVLRPSKQNKQGEAPIGVVISAGGTRTYVSTSKFIPVSSWDTQRQCVKGNSEKAKTLNDFLIEYRNNIYRKEVELVKRGYVISSEVLKDAIQNHVEELQQKKLLEVLAEHNAEKKLLVQMEYNVRTTRNNPTFIQRLRSIQKVASVALL